MGASRKIASLNNMDGSGAPLQQLQQLGQLFSQLQTEFTQQMDTMRKGMETMHSKQEQGQEANREQIRMLQKSLANLTATVPAAPATGPARAANLAVPAADRAAPTATPAISTPDEEGSSSEESSEDEGDRDAVLIEQTDRKKMILPDPPRFDGNRKKFRNWKLEMVGKLRTDGHLMGGPADHFTYIFSRLGDHPQSLAAAFYERGHGRHADPVAAFFQHLTGVYGNPNQAKDACGKLEKLKQGNTPFAAYLPKFEKELADAGGDAWPHDVRIDYLKRTLNDEMTTQLRSQRKMPTKYHKYVVALQELAGNLEDTYLRKKAPSNSGLAKSGGKPVDAAPAADLMDWEPTKVSKIRKAIQKQNKDLEGKRAKWVSQEELDRRREDGDCLRCGRPGCRIAKCPLLPAKRPSAETKKVKAKKAKPTKSAKPAKLSFKAAVVEDDDSPSSSSGDDYLTGESDSESGKE